MMTKKLNAIVFFLLFLHLCLLPQMKAAGMVEHLAFHPISSFDELPSAEVNQIIQDNKGYIWMATNSGLCRYDGYTIRVYKDNLYDPGLLTDNAIKRLAADKEDRLWIGTDNGLNVMDMRSGTIDKVNDERFRHQEIAALYISSDNHVWVGVNDGLYHFDADKKEWSLYQTTGKYEIRGVKSILEDSKGRLWIGTWAGGLYRYDREQKIFISYPPFEGQNSAHVIYEDSRQGLWIGSWDHGLYKMFDPETPESASYRKYVHQPDNPQSLSDNMVYCIEEDTTTGTLWIGTRSGLSILDLNTQDNLFINYLPDDNKRKLPYNELDALLSDKSGMMWLGMVGGGVYNVNMRPAYFQSYPLESLKEKLFSNSVRSLFTDRDESLWISLGSYGLAIQDKNDTHPVYYREHPDFKQQNIQFHTVNHIIERKETDEILFGTWGDGMILYDKKAKGIKIRTVHPDNAPWLRDNFIFYLHEDDKKNIWVGCRSGVSVYYPDGNGLNLNDYLSEREDIHINSTFYSIQQTQDGLVWLGGNNGIICVEGDPQAPEMMT